MKKDIAQNLIQKTRDDYNLIADQFASTRKYNWKEVKETLEDILVHFDHKKTIRVLDIGCGAGRVYDFFKDYEVEYSGIDLSDELIKIAQKHYPKVDFRQGDATDLPYPDNCFDIVLSIATIHHIPSSALRAKFLQEACRVTKKGGWVFIETWYFWNKPKVVINIFRNYFKSLWRNKFRTSKMLPLGDFYKPWKNANGTQLTKRYFHAWRIFELKRAIQKAGFTNVKVYKFYLKTRNLNIIGKKPQK